MTNEDFVIFGELGGKEMFQNLHEGSREDV